MVLRWLATMGMLVAAAEVCANVVPTPIGDGCGVVQTTLQREHTFASVVAAVGAMAHEHLAASVRADREYVGAVLQDDEGRYWSAVGIGCSGQDTVTFAVGVPVGYRLSAFWHTHGAAGPMRDWFSPEDIELVATTGYDFYLITPSGGLRVLSRADVKSGSHRALRQFGPGMQRTATVGRTVPWPQEPDERVTTCTAAEVGAAV